MSSSRHQPRGPSTSSSPSSVTSSIIDEIPILKQTGINLISRSHERVMMCMPLAPNTNPRGTMYGGSVYSVCLISSVQMCQELARHLGYPRSYIVGVKVSMEHVLAVKEDAIAVATVIEGPSLTELHINKKSYAKISVKINDSKKDKLAVAFEGVFQINILEKNNDANKNKL
jgi:thioesterase domain-containing protein